MKPIADGIFQLVTPFPEFSRHEAYQLREEMERHPRVTRNLPYVLAYLVASRGETLLVDCGWKTEEAFEALREEFQQARVALSDLQNVIITHAHSDHCGLAARVQGLTGCKVWMHEWDLVHLSSDHTKLQRWQEANDRYLVEHGVPSEDLTELRWNSDHAELFLNSFRVDRPLTGGETISVGDFVFEVVWTPGHSPGHICLYEPNRRMLLTGDHVLPTITPNVSVDPDNPGNPLKDFLAGLRSVSSLNVDKRRPNVASA